MAVVAGAAGVAVVELVAVVERSTFGQLVDATSVCPTGSLVAAVGLYKYW